MPLAAVAAVAGATIVSHIAGERAATAQKDIAEAKLTQEQADRAKALKFAEATPQELEQINRSIALNEADIGRKQRLLDSSDPAIIESGEQALKLLRGEEAKSLAPLKTNIAKQEQLLRQKLQAQLGSGYENTTAGIQALQAFNEQANASISGAQESALGRLLGVAQDTSSRYGMQSNISNTAALSQLFGGISSRQVSALTGAPITMSGAGFVGDLQSSRNLQNTIGTALQGASLLSGAGAFGGGGGGEKVSQFSGGGGPISGQYSLNSGAEINPFRYK